jgi:monoterpene epsilon-lactone hydrolase
MASKEYEQLRAALKPGLAVAEDETMLVREKMTAVHPTQVPADASVERVELGGVPCAWVTTPEVEAEDRVVLLVHGGAFVSTKLEHYIPYCAGLARHLPARFLVHEYSLAPEARFPTQIEQTMAVYEALLAQGIDASRIAFAGDSCGGGIAVATLCRLRDAGRPLPAGFVGLTPWFDLEQTGDSAVKPRGVDPYVNGPWIRARGRDYVGPGGDVCDPLVSPVHADLSGLPPMFLSVGEIDTTRDDSTRLAANAGGCGVDVTLEINAAMIHGFHGLAAMFPEGRESLERAGAFLRRVIP